MQWKSLPPGNGAQLAALQTTTGVAPVVVGKPEPWMYEEAMRRMGARSETGPSKETTAVVGDRLNTDIVAPRCDPCCHRSP